MSKKELLEEFSALQKYIAKLTWLTKWTIHKNKKDYILDIPTGKITIVYTDTGKIMHKSVKTIKTAILSTFNGYLLDAIYDNRYIYIQKEGDI